MRKTVLYIAMSLDGFVADKSGGVEWLQGDGSESENMGTFTEFYETIDTIILGYNTYYQIVSELSPNKWVYEGKKCFVITNKQVDDHNDITFTNEKLSAIIEKLKSLDGSDIWICGGASIAQALIQDDLIDEYRISIIPTILGDGISLFASVNKNLTLMKTLNYNGIVELCYKRR